MSKPIISVEGRRLYIKTQYGDPCVPALKKLGAHWEPQTKRWWISTSKREDVEEIIRATADKPNTADANIEIMVLGKAKYKGRNYYVRWAGQTKNGDYKARLCSLDGKLDFWVNAARPHEFSIDGNGDIAAITKTYQEAMSLDSIRRYIERLKTAQENNNVGDKPDEDCYLGANGEWLVKGCGECARLGHMCKSCRFDIYDD